MKLPLLFVTIFAVRANSFYQLPTSDSCINNVTKAREYVNSLSKAFEQVLIPERYIRWVYETNKSSGDLANIIKKDQLSYRGLTSIVTSKLGTFCWNNFNDKSLTRLATEYYIMGDKVTKRIVDEYVVLVAKMRAGYDKIKLCKFENCLENPCNKELDINFGLKKAMAEIRNPEELEYYWTEWHNTVGNGMRDLFIDMSKLRQEADQLMGFKNPAQRQFVYYQMDNLTSLMQDAYTKTFDHHGEDLSLEILYKEIHTFVKGKLIDFYNSKGVRIANDGPIPAHLVGDMIGENWRNIIELAIPFPDASSVNVTKYLLKNNKKVKDIVIMADNFFNRLGFDRMNDKFWDNSMFEKPKDGTEVNCIAGAWNMNYKDDFRIKMCANVTYKYFHKIHEKMADIVFYKEVKDLPFAYRTGANPGMRSALSGMFGLAVRTPSYLSRVGLLDGNDDSTSNDVIRIENVDYKKSDINYMMRVALEKIVHLPFCLSRESYRWDYFTGQISDSNLNGEFWEIVKKFQGLAPPVARNETNFDIGADYHIVNRYSLIGEFFSYLTQFQFYEALCKIAGEYDPNSRDTQDLHLCDFSKKGEEVGNILKNAMGKGKTEHWTKIMNDIAGVKSLSGESMVKYFLPLYRYLKQENEQGGLRPWK